MTTARLRCRGDHRGDRGAAAVEFALLLPVVLLIIFGIIDFGRMLHAQILLTEAAREGARAAALQSAAAGQARVNRVASSLGTVTTTIVECPAAGGTNSDAVVDVQHTFTFITPLGFLIGGNGTMNMTGHGAMSCLH